MPHVPAQRPGGQRSTTGSAATATRGRRRRSCSPAASPRHAAFRQRDGPDGDGAFDRHGFRRLHVAGHPEGNRDIDGDGSTRALDAALAWKQAFAERTGAQMAIVTQFAFDAGPVIAWAERLRDGIGLPIHVGVAGPAKLRTLLRYGYACGVGPRSA